VSRGFSLVPARRRSADLAPRRPVAGSRAAEAARSGHHALVRTLLDEFAQQRPEAVVHRGGETFVDIDAVEDLLNEAERRSIRVLGLEGFLVADDGVYPAFGRIADLSEVVDAQQSASLARDLVRGTWRTLPTAADEIGAEARGRHMLTVVLDA
jgi:hypothetical protein